MEEAQFRIPNDLVLNPQTPPIDIAVYGYLSVLSITYLNHPVCLTPHTIAYEIFGNVELHLKEVRDSMIRLSTQYPLFINQLGANTFCIDHDSSQAARHTTLWQHEVEKILHSDYSYKISLLKTFAVIVSSFQGKIKIADRQYFATDYTEGWYEQNLNMASVTIKKYINCLENLSLIYVLRETYKNNIISRYADSNLTQQWAVKHGYSAKTFSSDANRKRSLMQMFNRFKKAKESGAEIPYSPSEIKEIKKYISERNEKYRAWANFDPRAYDKIIDMAIFN